MRTSDIALMASGAFVVAVSTQLALRTRAGVPIAYRSFFVNSPRWLGPLPTLGAMMVGVGAADAAYWLVPVAFAIAFGSVAVPVWLHNRRLRGTGAASSVP